MKVFISLVNYSISVLDTFFRIPRSLCIFFFFYQSNFIIITLNNTALLLLFIIKVHRSTLFNLQTHLYILFIKYNECNHDSIITEHSNGYTHLNITFYYNICTYLHIYHSRVLLCYHFVFS